MRIRFIRHANQYNAGETADFDDAEASRLVQHEYAEFVAPVDGMVDEAPVLKSTLLAAATAISPIPYKKAPRFAALGPDMTDEQRHEQDKRDKRDGNTAEAAVAAHDSGSSRGPRTDGGDEARLRDRTPIPVVNEAEAAKAAAVKEAEHKAEKAAHEEGVSHARTRKDDKDDDETPAADLRGHSAKPHRK